MDSVLFTVFGSCLGKEHHDLASSISLCELLIFIVHLSALIGL